MPNKNQALIADGRDYALVLHSSAHVRHTGAELIDKLCDALEAAATEPEWEYGVVRSATGNCWPVADIHEAREAAVDGYEAIRRRPCSPWQPLPVEGENA